MAHPTPRVIARNFLPGLFNVFMRDSCPLCREDIRRAGRMAGPDGERSRIPRDPHRRAGGPAPSGGDLAAPRAGPVRGGSGGRRGGAEAIRVERPSQVAGDPVAGRTRWNRRGARARARRRRRAFRARSARAWPGASGTPSSPRDAMARPSRSSTSTRSRRRGRTSSSSPPSCSSTPSRARGRSTRRSRWWTFCSNAATRSSSTRKACGASAPCCSGGSAVSTRPRRRRAGACGPGSGAVRGYRSRPRSSRNAAVARKQGLRRECLRGAQEALRKAETPQARWSAGWTVAEAHARLGEEDLARQAIARAGPAPEGAKVYEVLWVEARPLAALGERGRLGGLLREPAPSQRDRFDPCISPEVAPMRGDARHRDIFARCPRLDDAGDFPGGPARRM